MWISATPSVDCTVNAVIAEIPKQPCAAKTCRSAVMPAPLEGSWPAMVRRVGIGVPGVGKERGNCQELGNPRDTICIITGHKLQQNFADK